MLTPDGTARWLGAVLFGELVLWDFPCSLFIKKLQELTAAQEPTGCRSQPPPELTPAGANLLQEQRKTSVLKTSVRAKDPAGDFFNQRQRRL